MGGARTALYNWLFARANDGTLILRSDDTDLERNTPEYAADILDSVRWLGLDWDEGIEIGGPHGSYRQSERVGRYQDVAQHLVAEGKAYYSFATAGQLDEFRRLAREQGVAPAYDGRHEPDEDEVRARIEAGEEATIRFRVPRPGSTTFHDLVRGDVTFDHSQVDDFVILRSNETPTYHLASTVDDVDYGITHVIRGEDLLSSTPKHVLLTEALDAEPPSYAHLSLLMGPDGKKLSKRHGDTAVAAYRNAGYLPEALVNYLALLGWNPGEDDTVLPLDEMVRRFDLSAVSRNPAIFDPDKLEWMDGVYIRDLSADEFVRRAVPWIEGDLGWTLDEPERACLFAIAPHIQERTKLMTEVPEQVRFLLVDDIAYEEASWRKVMAKDGVPEVLDAAATTLADLEQWDTASIDAALRSMLAERELSARKGLQPIRVAVSGSTVSPPLFESLEVLGRETTLGRLATARSLLGDRS